MSVLGLLSAVDVGSSAASACSSSCHSCHSSSQGTVAPVSQHRRLCQRLMIVSGLGASMERQYHFTKRGGWPAGPV